MIKTTIYFFTDGYGPAEPLPVEDSYDVDLHLLPSVGSTFTFQSYDTAISQDTYKVERRRVSITGRVIYSNQLIMDDGTQYVKLSVQASNVEYGSFQPIPINAHNVICHTPLGTMTVKEYMIAVLCKLWEEKDDFSMGDSGWQYRVYEALIGSGHVEGVLDDDGYVDSFDRHKAEAFVLNMIRKNLWRI